MTGASRAATPAVLISNPSAGRGRRLKTTERILEALRAGGYDVEMRTTHGPGHATQLARQAAIEGAGAVFAYGGDGTLREAAAGLLGTRVPIGFIPGGTTNVMALTLGLPTHPLEAAAAFIPAEAGARAGSGVREMDVGLCGDEAFLMLASAGFDARVVTTLPAGIKRRFGKLAVAVSALRHAPTYRFPLIEVEADGRRLEPGTLVAVCNIPYYGGPWRLAPRARTDDRRFDLFVFRGKGLLATAALARDLVIGQRHLGRADVETLTVEEVKLLPGEAPVEIDGDLYRPAGRQPPGSAKAPLSIRLSHVRLRVLAPHDSAPSLR
jgi:YegS/Rv2252/BmrU family lipid kinase